MGGRVSARLSKVYQHLNGVTKIIPDLMFLLPLYTTVLSTYLSWQQGEIQTSECNITSSV